jgi:hypothetical protein
MMIMMIFNMSISYFHEIWELFNDFQNLLSTMSCWRINEESHSHVNVNIQIFLLLEEWNHS